MKYYTFDKNNFHIFSKRRKWYLFGVNNLAVFKIHPIIKKILNLNPPISIKNTMTMLKKYSSTNIIDSFQILKEMGLLREVTDKDKQSLVNQENNNLVVNDDSNLKTLNGLYLSVSENCNLRCRYCSADFGRFGTGRTSLMSKEVARKAIDLLLCSLPKDSKSSSNLTNSIPIVLTGGEPLLNFEVIKFLVEYSRKKSKEFNVNINFSTNTNGTLITKEIAEFLVLHRFDVRFSIDGKKERHDLCRIYPDGKGTYDDVIKGYECFAKIQKKPVEVIQASILHGRCIKESVQHLWDLGSNVIIANPTIPVYHSPEKYSYNKADQKEYIKQFMEICEEIAEGFLNNKKKTIHLPSIYLERIHNRIPVPPGCGVVKMAGINSDGNIYPCQALMNNEEFRLGNVDSGLELKALNLFYSKYYAYLKKCNTCWTRNLCGSACIGQAILNNELGSKYEANRYCEQFRKTSEILMYMYYIIKEKDYELPDKLYNRPQPQKEMDVKEGNN